MVHVTGKSAGKRVRGEGGGGRGEGGGGRGRTRLVESAGKRETGGKRVKSATSSGASILVAKKRARSTRIWGQARNARDQGKEKEESLSSFPLPFLPCAPTSFAAKETRETARKCAC